MAGGYGYPLGVALPVDQALLKVRGAYILQVEHRVASGNVLEISHTVVEESGPRRDKGGLGAFLV